MSLRSNILLSVPSRLVRAFSVYLRARHLLHPDLSRALVCEQLFHRLHLRGLQSACSAEVWHVSRCLTTKRLYRSWTYLLDVVGQTHDFFA